MSSVLYYTNNLMYTYSTYLLLSIILDNAHRHVILKLRSDTVFVISAVLHQQFDVYIFHIFIIVYYIR